MSQNRHESFREHHEDNFIFVDRIEDQLCRIEETLEEILDELRHDSNREHHGDSM